MVLQDVFGLFSSIMKTNMKEKTLLKKKKKTSFYILYLSDFLQSIISRPPPFPPNLSFLNFFFLLKWNILFHIQFHVYRKIMERVKPFMYFFFINVQGSLHVSIHERLKNTVQNNHFKKMNTYFLIFQLV